MSLDPYAIASAVLAPAFDVGMVVVARSFWLRQMVLYNDDQVAESQVNYFLNRSVVIASHLSFVALWPMSALGTVARAYPLKAVQFGFSATLFALIVAWVYSISQNFKSISTGRARYVLIACRVIGYAVSLALAIVVGGAP